MIKQFINGKTFRNNLLVTILFLFCITGIIWLQKPFLNRKDNITIEQYQKEQNVRELKLKLFRKIPSLGFENLIADWLFLDFIQYYGDAKAREVTGYDSAPDYFELVVKKDPHFVTSYFILEPASTLFAGKPEKSVELMNYGLKYIDSSSPLAYQVWLYKGISEVLFLGKIPEAKKSYEMAAKWAEIENTPSSLSSAKIARQTAAFLAKNPDSKSARAGSWMMILGNARDEQTRAMALENLKALGATVTFKDNLLSVQMPEE